MIYEILAPVANHLWQSTLFATAVGLLTVLLKKNRAAVRYGLWFAASIKFLLPFSLLVALGSQLGWPADGEPAQALIYALDGFSQPFAAETFTLTSSSTSMLSLGNADHGPARLPVALFVVWFSGAAIVCLRWVREWRRMRAAVKQASPVKLTLPLPVLMTAAPIEPGIVGVLRPVLILPQGLMGRLSRAQVDAVLTHELCHVRRRDNLAATLHMIVETMFWFHPLVWWIEGRLITERERACDEEVLYLGGNPQAYAEGILNVCKFFKESSLACVSGVTGSNLKKRIEDIMKNSIAQNLSFVRLALLAFTAIMALAGPVAFGTLKASATRTFQSVAQPTPSLARPTPSVSDAQQSAPVQMAQAQPAPQVPTVTSQSRVAEKREIFEVATVRPTRFAAGGERGAGGGGAASIRPAGEPCGDHPNSFFLKFDPSRADISDMTVYGLIAWAYGLECPPFKGSYLLFGGPGWIRSDGFDIQAKIPEGTTVYTEQAINVRGAPPTRQTMNPTFRKMLQSLLEDRFKLVLRRGTREIPVYVLTVAKGGPKLRTWKEGDPATQEDWYKQLGLPGEREMYQQARELGQLDRGWFIGFKGTAAQLINQVKRGTDRPLVDRTGITTDGLIYRFPYSELLPPFPTVLTPQNVTSPSAPSLFAALEEELGLKLEATTAPMEVWVIDRVERPTEN